MSPAITRLKRRLRPIKAAWHALLGYGYDYCRFIRHSAWSLSNKDDSIRNYLAVKVYHRLEKSLSFRNRKPGAGWDAVYELLGIVRASQVAGPRGFQDQIAVNVLKTFVSEVDAGNQTSEKVAAAAYVANLEGSPGLGGGYETLAQSDMEAGRLGEPEKFFLSRYSVRDYSDQRVDDADIMRAINLARKTPSVCSRQAWHVYHLNERCAIDRALKYQNGNRGFGHEVPTLLIVSADLKAFDSGGERYQHWVDGGMFAMSLVYALHALGIGSCCLNWSRTVFEDRAFRKEFPIAPEHTIIMMIACGYPRDHVRVCASVRRPIDEVYTHLALR